MHTAALRNALAFVGALTIGALTVTGCGTTGEATVQTAPASPGTAADTSGPDAAAEPAQVARLTAAADVFDAPDGGVVRTLDAATGFGSQTVLLVTDTDRSGWLEVMLPGRPNEALGWIRSDAAEVREVALEVRIDLAARELSLLDAGTAVWTTPTAIGDPEHPTPTGSFYVTDKLDTGDPNGAYGPYALGLSARSDVLTEFAGGDGQIGIHGTNLPGSIGQAVSHGCLRIDNALVAELAALLPLGTPVTIS
ncbi:L,D-transpeptidase [Microbacterium xanthum]|uniref:L,D-transpeptidase n=1 Tax=Microbacterium xanthum TaxID=3079794 RepID=UPI002AD53DDD|nr:L,D-transpeptidase family protein [Microbacterium sp. KSW-48]MDZ8173099.1 L,D-transpeptidase family protein [Microbacterium sp. KSW-48]